MKKMVLAFVCGVLALAGCTKKEEPAREGARATKTWPPGEPVAAVTPSGDAAVGKTIYSTRCTACHSPDPKLAGALGPEVWGSSLELLETRILSATYPSGYKPKRATKVMVALPDLEGKIADLHAYLNQ